MRRCGRNWADLLRRYSRPDEPIAARRQRLDPLIAAGLARKSAPKRPNLDGQIALLDRKAGPCSFDERILGYRRA